MTDIMHVLTGVGILLVSIGGLIVLVKVGRLITVISARIQKGDL